ncbi:hypothetical protein MWU75_04255 [Ornithinimicrobium sp. F0845]|uniref:hypothetical protein n=1 Tax=Ornithinimicrobium sp. F0845 TaxID=2926412 RepID=UPI001FF1B063|nr:hypothetical protein [Ornithinimicrobium sp. F0845]MCK0111347.1 hypothetical protein [Ornithinimicrobium sp. F0845]
MKPSNELMSMHILSGAFIGAIAIIAVVMVLVAPETVVPEPWVIAVLLGLVATSALFSLMLVQQIPAAQPGSTLSDMLAKVRVTHMLRLALAEAPVILAIVLMFLASEPSWVTVAIAAVPTVIVMLLLIFPTEGVLRRYQKSLDAAGVNTRFADRMLGRA